MEIVGTNLFAYPSGRLGPVTLFVAGRRWTVDDAVAFSVFRGELRPAVGEALALAAAEEEADEEGVVIDDESLQASSEKFRYEHGLISAGETEEWLSTRGMTTEDFGHWLYQSLCRKAAPRDALLTDPSDLPDDFGDLLRVHLWLSGEMDRISEQLARRVAAGLELNSGGEADGTRAVIDSFLEREQIDRRALPEWLEANGRDERWLDEIARLEAAYERVSSAAVDEDSRRRKLAAMERSLSTLEFDLLELDSAGAAREALLCVQDDRIPLSEVARDAGYKAVRSESCLEDLGPIGERLSAAPEGAVVGPIESDGRFRLYHLIRKQKPSLSEPDLSRRIDTMILDELFEGLTARHVESQRVAASL